MNHESNTFNPIITTEDDFLTFRGDEILERGLNPGYSLTGIIKRLREEGAEIVPTVLCRAVPNGPVSASFYKKIKDDILTRAREALSKGEIHGICLALHGSMKVEGLGNAEEDLCLALREVLAQIPMTLALDMHASITPGLVETADGIVGYKTAPHTDSAETGYRAADMLIRALKTGLPLKTYYEKIPMLIAGEKSETDAEPMVSLIKACITAESEPSILSASLFMGFPWADDEHNGVAVLLTCLDDGRAPERAEELTKEIAASVWERRRDFKFRAEHYGTKAALEAAYSYAEAGEKPIFISDSGDNPTAGSTGDSTDLLEAIISTMDRLDKLPTPFLYSGFFDAPAVACCIKAGEGAGLSITIGGNWDTINGKKIPLKVRVKKIVRDYGPYKSDLALIMHRNLLIVITSKHIGFGDPALLPSLGINPEDHCLIAVKLGYLEPCFRKIARRAILATTKGYSNEIIESIPYKKVKRPVFPLDEDA